jgi:hypothetical protein
MTHYITITCQVQGTPTDVPYCVADVSGVHYPAYFSADRTHATYVLSFDEHAPSPPMGWGAWLEWQGKRHRIIVPSEPGDYLSTDLEPPFETMIYNEPPPQPVLPPVPTREDVCGINLTFQGLTVRLPNGVDVLWFELVFQCLDRAGREAVYQTKRAAGDTHLIVEFMDGRPVYHRPPLNGYRSPDFNANPAAFYELVYEVIAQGFIPIVVFDGDNADAEPYGSHNALRQLPVLADLFQRGPHNLVPYILFARFWDGVFYGSTPENIQLFGTEFRKQIPTGYLAIEHQPGRIPCGGGPGDWTPNGRMTGYDVVVSEYDYDVHQDSTWQVAGRTLGPAYKRPPDQPPADDPKPPFYLVDSPRGPRYTCAMEWQGAWQWVQGLQTAAYQTEIRRYMKSMGYRYTG